LQVLAERALMVEPDEMVRDLHREKIYAVVYLLGGVGLFGVGVALVVIFGVRKDIPALILGIVAFIWSVLLVVQSRKTRKLVKVIEARAAEADRGFAPAPTARVEEGEEHERAGGGGGSGEP
jgi:hypothetical protein